jgi:hypothetical protein
LTTILKSPRAKDLASNFASQEKRFEEGYDSDGHPGPGNADKDVPDDGVLLDHHPVEEGEEGEEEEV